MDVNVLFTGHSLGGGLAACAASHSSSAEGITFDAMGVPKKKFRTMREITPDDYFEDGTLRPGEYLYNDFNAPSHRIYNLNYLGTQTANIENYYNNLDFVTCLQEASSIAAEAVGTPHNVDEPLSKEEEEEEDRKKLIEILKKIPGKLLSDMLLIICFGVPFWIIIELITILLYKEDLGLIAESIDVHRQLKEALIPALEKWIERQKKLEKQKELEDSKPK